MVEIDKEMTERAYKLIREEEVLKYLTDYDFEFVVLKSDKSKTSKGRTTFGECKKVDEVYKPFTPYDFLIIIYADADLMTDEQRRILLIHEMMHMSIDDRTGEPKYSINPHDIEDFRYIIDTYGLDWGKVVE